MVRTTSGPAIVVRTIVVRTIVVRTTGTYNCGPDKLWSGHCGPLFKIVEITYFVVSTYIAVLMAIIIDRIVYIFFNFFEVFSLWCDFLNSRNNLFRGSKIIKISYLGVFRINCSTRAIMSDKIIYFIRSDLLSNVINKPDSSGFGGNRMAF